MFSKFESNLILIYGQKEKVFLLTAMQFQVYFEGSEKKKKNPADLPILLVSYGYAYFFSFGNVNTLFPSYLGTLISL